jgi:hypothetical protein
MRQAKTKPATARIRLATMSQALVELFRRAGGEEIDDDVAADHLAKGQRHGDGDRRHHLHQFVVAEDGLAESRLRPTMLCRTSAPSGSG